jgi:nuclease S1
VSGTLLIDALVSLVCVAQPGIAWGREGHEVVALIAEHYMTGAAKAKATALLDGSSIESVASWADDYRSDHRETAPWHFINSPLTHYRIVLVRDCPRGQCVVAKGGDSL